MISALKISVLPLILTCLLLFVALNYLYYNPSISEPLGYYLVLPGSGYQKGNTVLTCIDSKQHKQVFNQLGLADDGSCNNGLPYLLKTIVAMEGDTVQVVESGILVNGIYQQNSAQFKEADGVKLYPLPIGWKCTLKQGDYFVMGQSLHSLDSRYFGVVNKSLIYSKTILIWPKQ